MLTRPAPHGLEDPRALRRHEAKSRARRVAGMTQPIAGPVWPARMRVAQPQFVGS